MKRTLLAVLTALVCTTASAQSADPTASLRNWATKMLPRCPGGAVVLERVAEAAPQNFVVYAVTLRSQDQYCGKQTYLLHSPKTQQVLLGTILPLPADTRAANLRVAETTSEILKTKITATVAPFPLPDGVKAVTMTKPTPHGPFAYHGFVDGSERFLIVGIRGSLQSDTVKTLLDSLNASTTAIRRGKKDAKVEIIELSDFQCPTCARAHEKLEPLIKANLGKISYARIDLPLFEHHEWSIPAAMAGRAINKVAPGKYWEYVDYVFKNQEAIGKMDFDKFIKDYAEDHDISWKAFEPHYRSKTDKAALLDQVSRAFDVGINSTPTFIVNGQILGFGPEGTFTYEAVRAAINSAAPPAATKAAAPAKKK